MFDENSGGRLSNALSNNSIVGSEGSSSGIVNAQVRNSSANGTSYRGNDARERKWKIKEYANLKQALKDTKTYYDELEARKTKYSNIDGDLYKPNVFAGPIADDCHENGYVKLDGYMESLMKDVKFIGEWFTAYIQECAMLEDATQKDKISAIESYAPKLSVKNVHSGINK